MLDMAPFATLRVTMVSYRFTSFAAGAAALSELAAV